ncbi:MAG: type II toxin-antitoxin system HicB family antitoxin [Clostridia bacterium]
MAKFVYPAKLESDDGHLMVTFPDIPNCLTEGDSLVEALELAEDALCMILADLEDKCEALPAPTDINTLHCEQGETLALVKADTLAYRRRTSHKVIKKTLTIPCWVNEAAERHGVNYSQLLQEAILKHIGIE